MWEAAGGGGLSCCEVCPRELGAEGRRGRYETGSGYRPLRAAPSAYPGQGRCRAGNGLAKMPSLCRLSGGAAQRGIGSGRWGRSSRFCRQAEQTEPS